MKNYRDSDWAVNKTASGIVYRFADQTVEVKLEDYLRENPDKTAADFAELKALSDEMYLEDDRADYRQTWKNVPIHTLEETDACCIPSAESITVDAPEDAANQERQRELASAAFEKLTGTQRRRYIQHFVKGLSTWEIACREGVYQHAVMLSIQAAEKKIEKYFKIF